MRGDADAVAAAADLLAKAERPVIIAGDAVAQSRAHKELAALAEAIAAPVYVEFIPNTASFPASHPLYRGMMTRTQAGVREVLDKHDLVFSVGGDLFTWSLPSAIDPWPAGLPLIHLDTDPWQIGKNYPAQGRHPRRSEGDAARHHAGVGARMTRERQERRERAAEIRDRHHQERPRSVSRQGPRHGRQDAGAAARAPRSDRRDAAEGCRGDRGNLVVLARRAHR
jgi:benzoylformate decarboxylase